MPRCHPERFPKAIELTAKAGLSYTLRSKGEVPSSSTQVVIAIRWASDAAIRYVDLAFVGGSLVERGGHNPLEAAAHAIPVLMGPHTFNFKDICAKLEQAEGLITVTDTLSLVKESPSYSQMKIVASTMVAMRLDVLHENQARCNDYCTLVGALSTATEPLNEWPGNACRW